jgi:hypothetical protein
MTEINGVTHSWDDVDIIVQGRHIKGIERLDYVESEDDPEPVYNMGSREVAAMGLGVKQLVDVTIELREQAWQDLKGIAQALGVSVLDLWPMTIVASYSDKADDGGKITKHASALTTETITHVKFSRVERTQRVGDKVLRRTISGKGIAVVY